MRLGWLTLLLKAMQRADHIEESGQWETLTLSLNATQPATGTVENCRRGLPMICVKGL